MAQVYEDWRDRSLSRNEVSAFGTRMKEKMQDMMGGMMGAQKKGGQSSEFNTASMLTAMGEEMDRVVALELGADDDLAKPYSAREPLARIRAVLRRGSSTMPRVCIMLTGAEFVMRARLLTPDRLRTPTLSERRQDTDTTQ